MIPFISSKINSNKIEILGVSHIKANLNSVLNELNKLDIDSNTLIFIEPRKTILTGQEICHKKSVGFFFAMVLKYVMGKKASIIPLNPKKMPSHNSNYVLHKYAHQFAEEEYMADLIENTKHDGKIVVIIGDVHAERLKELLGNKGKRVNYKKVAPITPDDIVIKSLRSALAGKSSEMISMEWLKKINSEIKEMLNIKNDVIVVQEAVWDNEKSFALYQELVKKLMKKHKQKDFKIKVEEDLKIMAKDLKKVGEEVLARNKNKDDHPVFSFPYQINMPYVESTSVETGSIRSSI